LQSEYPYLGIIATINDVELLYGVAAIYLIETIKLTVQTK